MEPAIVSIPLLVRFPTWHGFLPKQVGQPFLRWSLIVSHGRCIPPRLPRTQSWSPQSMYGSESYLWYGRVGHIVEATLLNCQKCLFWQREPIRSAAPWSTQICQKPPHFHLFWLFQLFTSPEYYGSYKSHATLPMKRILAMVVELNWSYLTQVYPPISVC